MTHDLISIVKQLKYLQAKYHLLIIGEAAKQEIVEYKKINNLKNLTLLDSIPKESVPSYINAIDLSLIHLKKCDTFKNVIPSKIFENVAMEKKNYIRSRRRVKKNYRKYNLGVTFEPGNFNDFVSALDKSKLLKTKNRDQFLKDLVEITKHIKCINY